MIEKSGAVDNRSSSNKLEHDAAQGPHVYSRGIVSSKQCLFGGVVIERPNADGVPSLRDFELLGSSEICEFDVVDAVAEDILRLQISMDDSTADD